MFLQCFKCSWNNEKIFRLVMTERMDQLPSHSNLCQMLWGLKQRLLRRNISKLAILKIEYSRGGLNRRRHTSISSSARAILRTTRGCGCNGLCVYTQEFFPLEYHFEEAPAVFAITMQGIYRLWQAKMSWFGMQEHLFIIFLSIINESW